MTTTVQHTVTDPETGPVRGAQVIVDVFPDVPGYVDALTSTIVAPRKVRTDANGLASFAVVPNALIVPGGTAYRVRDYPTKGITRTHYITVPYLPLSLLVAGTGGDIQFAYDGVDMVETAFDADAVSMLAALTSGFTYLGLTALLTGLDVTGVPGDLAVFFAGDASLLTVRNASGDADPTLTEPDAVWVGDILTDPPASVPSAALSLHEAETIDGDSVHGGVSLALGDLTDVLIPAPSVDDLLQWDGAEWHASAGQFDPSGSAESYSQSVLDIVAEYRQHSYLFDSDMDGLYLAKGIVPQGNSQDTDPITAWYDARAALTLSAIARPPFIDSLGVAGGPKSHYSDGFNKATMDGINDYFTAANVDGPGTAEYTTHLVFTSANNGPGGAAFEQELQGASGDPLGPQIRCKQIGASGGASIIAAAAGVDIAEVPVGDYFADTGWYVVTVTNGAAGFLLSVLGPTGTGFDGFEEVAAPFVATPPYGFYLGAGQNTYFDGFISAFAYKNERVATNERLGQMESILGVQGYGAVPSLFDLSPSFAARSSILADVAGHFTSTDVEGALAEIAEALWP